MRSLLVLLLLGLFTGCGPQQTIIPRSTATAAQATLPAARVPPSSATHTVPSSPMPTLPVVRPQTPIPTGVATVDPAPSPGPPPDRPALLATTPPVTLTVQTAPADPAYRDLPTDVLLIEAPWRVLVLVDAAGTRLVTPTDELERLGWCGPTRDVFAPSGTWSASGRSLVVTCQARAEAMTTAILDLQQGQWTGIQNPGRWLVSPAVGDPCPAGEDHLSAAWVRGDEQLAITHHRTRWDTEEEFVSVYLFSLDDHTLRRIADFDGQSSTWSLRVAPDQRQIGMVARRADDPAASVYVWEEGSPLRQFPGVEDNPFSALTPVFAQVIAAQGNEASWTAELAPDGQSMVLKEPTGWQVYGSDGTAGVRVPDAPPPFRSHQAAWANDSTRWWICQVEEGVGGHLLEVDRQGQVQERAFYPNVAFASAPAPCVIESPQGWYAIGLSNGLVVITDADYRERGSVPGATQGWRPHR